MMPLRLPINAVFSGGPVDGKVMIIVDCLEYVFAIASKIDLFDMSLDSDPSTPLPIKKAYYKRTEEWDLNCNKIFEFVGIY